MFTSIHVFMYVCVYAWAEPWAEAAMGDIRDVSPNAADASLLALASATLAATAWAARLCSKPGVLKSNGCDVKE
jgi:hypothetical protein